MKSVQQSLLERRTIRRYERMKVEPEKMQQIYDAIRNTPTSYNGQQFSVIAVDDQQLKEQLYEITNQKQIKTCSASITTNCAWQPDCTANKRRPSKAPLTAIRWA